MSETLNPAEEEAAKKMEKEKKKVEIARALVELPELGEPRRYEEKSENFVDWVKELETGKRKEEGARYALFEINLENLESQISNSGQFMVKDKDLEDTLKRYVMRYSRKGELSHLGIAGDLIQEINKSMPGVLRIEDIKLKQSHHEEPAVLIEKEGFFRVEAIGGGFVDIDPQSKGILLRGRSKAFGAHLDTEVEGYPTFRALHGEWDSKKGESYYEKKQALCAGGILEKNLKKGGMNYEIDPKITEEERTLYEKELPERQEKARKQKEQWEQDLKDFPEFSI